MVKVTEGAIEELKKFVAKHGMHTFEVVFGGFG
jgi:hypothetical protein